MMIDAMRNKSKINRKKYEIIIKNPKNQKKEQKDTAKHKPKNPAKQNLFKKHHIYESLFSTVPPNKCKILLKAAVQKILIFLTQLCM